MTDKLKSFSDLKLSAPILDALKDLDLNTPTKIQEKAIPLIRAGHDFIGIAPTGTGKTAAYIIPLLLKLKFSQGKHARALILVPTRELVIQVKKMFDDLGKNQSLRHIAIFGGKGIKNQIHQIREGIDVLIATPGRFLDIYLRGEIYTKNLNTLILDEADKMMDMGFLPQLHRILEVIPTKKRQNLLFSATFPDRVQRLSEDFLAFPQKVEINPQGTSAETIDQFFYKTPNLKTKINLLSYLLSDNQVFNKVIIFTKTKETANNIYKFIHRKLDKNVTVIHANKGQNTRINAINSFKEGNIRILVSTDVTSRGIDVSMVSHVINFDVPLVYEDYVHRIGRTGRAYQTGVSITFVTLPDEYHLENIEKIIRKKIPEKKIPKDVFISETEPLEKKKLEIELDKIKRKLDPTFKGAFHPKKIKNEFRRKLK